jgi:hypothetical protein
MGVLDVVSLAILAILIVGALFLILIVAAIPGVIVKKRHSPWADAINVAGWIGALLPPIWMLALIAGFVRPQVGEGAQIAISQVRRLKAPAKSLAPDNSVSTNLLRGRLAKVLSHSITIGIDEGTSADALLSPLGRLWLGRKARRQNTTGQSLIHCRNQVSIHEQLNHIAETPCRMTNPQNVSVFMDCEEHDPSLASSFLKLLRHLNSTHGWHRDVQNHQVWFEL